MNFKHTTLLGAVALVAAACGPGSMSDPDASGGDAMMMMSMEGGTGDGGPSADAGSCAMTPVENLDTLGTRMGDTVRYMGDNRAAAMTTNGIQVPNQLQGFCAFRSTKQRIFLYTPRASGYLLVSTSNPGTTAGFDTTIAITRTNCRANGVVAADFLGCNDDDPTAGGDDRRITSSAFTFRQVTANMPVLIAVGGFVGLGQEPNAERTSGSFELTVREVAAVPNGMPCDRSGNTNACATGSSCVDENFPSGMGVCRADGSVAGATCSADISCAAGLSCDLDNGVCYRSVADGMPCNPLNRCGDNSTCVVAQPGASNGTCRPNGTTSLSRCRVSGMACDMGLTCIGEMNRVCVRLADRGGDCGFDIECPEGQSCVASSGLSYRGTCRDNGSVAGTRCAGAAGMGTCSGMNLSCITPMGSTASFCLTPAMAGQTCNPSTNCATGTNCFLTDRTVTTQGQCVAQGALGGACRTMGTACDMGMCSNTDASMGRCINRGMAGAACDLRSNFCADGLTCVRMGSGTFMGRCTAQGARGGGCRTGAMACDAGLTCSNSSGNGEGICQAAATGSCDAFGATDRCPMGQACRATSLETGTCAAPTMEMEPNNSATMSLPMVTGPALIRGSLYSVDTDCYAINVPAMGRVFARANNPSGLCSFELELTLLQQTANGLRPLGQDNGSTISGCPRIDGADMNNPTFDYARNLPAGRYYVCVNAVANENTNVVPPVPAYVLSLNATAP